MEQSMRKSTEDVSHHRQENDDCRITDKRQKMSENDDRRK